MLTAEYKIQKTIEIVRKAFSTDKFIPLHEPRFVGREKEMLNDCIDSTFVSYLGKYVTEFENQTAQFTGAKYCLSVVNGTAALHMAMLGVGVSPGTEVLTQSLTFVATANAIRYCNADLVFIDVDRETLGMSHEDLKKFFINETRLENGKCINKKSGKIISACIPVHIFGHPARIKEIVEVCQRYHVPVVEDSAESLGSYRDGTHTGRLGQVGILSYNGNKIITCGGGGAILTDDEAIFNRMKHLSTTAKIAHPWLYMHDQVGYNYRLPNLNAAVLVAQMENLNKFLQNKRQLAEEYKCAFADVGVQFFVEPEGCRSNYWLNALLLDNLQERELFLQKLNAAGVMSRPAWELMFKLAPFQNSQVYSSVVSEEMSQRLINIPSSVRL